MRDKSEAKVIEMEAARVAAAKRVTDAERAIAGAAARRQAYARLMRRFEERHALRVFPKHDLTRCEFTNPHTATLAAGEIPFDPVGTVILTTRRP